MSEHIEKVKGHIKRNRITYAAIGTGVLSAGLTALIMRSVASQSISRDTVVTAKGDTVVLGKRIAMNNVSFISSRRQGPPSWVVRCVETGTLFTSQNSAATEMNLPANQLSQHLNGVRDHVNGYHFERICMAA